MRRFLWPSIALALAASSTWAAEPKCPLDAHTCLVQYAEMRERPWLGIEFDQDSTGKRTILRVVEGSPAEEAGLEPGDVILKIEGIEATRLIAGKSGWRQERPARAKVVRDGRPLDLALRPGQIPDAYLARLMGIHMLEGHLAYMGTEEAGER